MLTERDLEVRAAVYDAAMRTGKVPRLAELAGFSVGAAGPAAQAGEPPATTQNLQDSIARLAAARHLVVIDGELRMVGPFSAVPTPFLVDMGDVTAFGNCIWDALGIPAILHRDGRIDTSCGCCGDPVTLHVESAKPRERDGIVHFALPPREWWNDIVFT